MREIGVDAEMAVEAERGMKELEELRRKLKKCRWRQLNRVRTRRTKVRLPAILHRPLKEPVDASVKSPCLRSIVRPPISVRRVSSGVPLKGHRRRCLATSSLVDFH